MLGLSGFYMLLFSILRNKIFTRGHRTEEVPNDTCTHTDLSKASSGVGEEVGDQISLQPDQCYLT